MRLRIAPHASFRGLSWVVALLVLAIATGAAGLGLAHHAERNDLVAPSLVTTGQRGLGLVAWTEIARPGVRVAREVEPGRWTEPSLVDPEGFDPDVAVSSGKRAVVAYTSERGVLIARERATASSSDSAPVFEREVVDPQGVGSAQVAVTPDERIYVAYATADGDIRIAEPVPGGWSIRVTGFDGVQPKLAADAFGRLLLAVRQPDAIRMTRIVPEDLRLPPQPDPGLEIPLTTASPSVYDVSVTPASIIAAYPQESDGRVVVARGTTRLDRRGVATTSGIGSFASTDSDETGFAALLFREPVRNLLTTAFLQDGDVVGFSTLGPGLSGDVALGDPRGRVQIAYWDYTGTQLLSARFLPERGGDVRPTPADPSVAPISTAQATAQMRDRAAIWLACLSLLAAVAAAFLAVRTRRKGRRLLPFGIALAVLVGFAIRGAYLAEAGQFGLPPHDLQALDGSAVAAVAEALVLLAGGAIILGITGLIVPRGWNGRAMRGLRSASLPSPSQALLAACLLTTLSLLVCGYLIAREGIDELLTARQVALANSGYLFLLLSAGTGSLLVYLAAAGLPRSAGAWALVGILGIASFVPLAVSGTRSLALLGFVLPAAFLIHFRLKRIGPLGIATGLVVLLVASLGFRVLVREPSYADELPTQSVEKQQPWLIRALAPVLGGTEAAGLDGFVLVREEHRPAFGTDPLLSAKAFAVIPIPRSVWSDKPRSAMDTFTKQLNPWRYSLGQVGQSTSLAGEFTMNWGAFALVGFVIFGLALCLLGELATGMGGVLGVLLACAFLPRVASATWGDSFNSGWGGIALAAMITLAFGIAAILGRLRR